MYMSRWKTAAYHVGEVVGAHAGEAEGGEDVVDDLM